MSSQRPRSSEYRVAARSVIRRRKRARILTAVVVALVVIIAAFVYNLFTSPVPQVQFASTQERDALANNTVSKAQTFSLQIRQPHMSPPILQIDEREANALLQSNQQIQAKLQEKGVSDPVIAFGKDQITLSARVPVGGTTMPVTVVGSLLPSTDGTPQFQVQNVMIGRVNAPESVCEKVASKIESLVNSGGLHLPPGTTGVKVEEGKLVATGR